MHFENIELHFSVSPKCRLHFALGLSTFQCSHVYRFSPIGVVCVLGSESLPGSWTCGKYINIYSVIYRIHFCLVVWNMNFNFPFSWECPHPKWWTHIFQRGRYTTNQIWHLTFSPKNAVSETPKSPISAKKETNHPASQQKFCIRCNHCKISALRRFVSCWHLQPLWWASPWASGVLPRYVTQSVERMNQPLVI